MGYGDDLMITAFAEKIKKKYPERQIVIGNISEKKAYDSIVYENNPNIANCNNLDFSKPIHIIDYHSKNRPYINYSKSDNIRYVWNSTFRVTPGKLYFSDKEINQAEIVFKQAKKYWYEKNAEKYEGIIFFESSATRSHRAKFENKYNNLDWGYENWKKLINNISSKFLIIQSSHENTKILDNTFISNKLGFRESCALMSKCDLYIGSHGGFSHVAAALKKKAVVYFGGWVSPDILGYQTHHNIYFNNTSSPCGSVGINCDHCQKAREFIKPDIFEEKILSYF